MKIHEARFKKHIQIGGFRSSGTVDIGGDNCVIAGVKQITPKKLDVKCRNTIDNNEQSQTIKALTTQGEGIVAFLEKNKLLLIGKKMSELYNLSTE
jgi:hypothetical protein